MNCPHCHQLLQQRLDGGPVPDPAALDAYLAACPECRSWHAAATRLQEGVRRLTPVVPPDGLADRLVAHVLADRNSRLRLRRRVAGAAAMAAGLLLALLAYQRFGLRDAEPPPGDAIVYDVPAPEAPAQPPSLQESVAEAGSAVASLTRRKADETVGQTWTWWADLVKEVPGPEAPVLDQPARPLREAGQNVTAGLEPVTSSARRALHLFLREIPPLEGETKRGS